MKVLFINQHTGSRTVPLASACLASALEFRFGEDIECPILELPPEFDAVRIARDIIAEEPDILALTLYSWSRKKLLELAGEFTGSTEAPENIHPMPRPLIIAGGPEVSADPGSVQAHPGVDLAAAGEGEELIVRIVEMMKADGHASIADLGAPFFSPAIADLDTLPSPWKARALEGGDWDDYVWELTRGCPFSCHFCFESKGSGRVRHKSRNRASLELAQLKDRGARRIFLLDPTFNAPPKRASELLNLFLKEAPEIAWHLEVRSEFLDEEQAELYAELGCTLQIGLQTADEAIADGIGRPFSAEEFEEKVLLLHREGVTYGLDLIWGLPGDTLEGFRRSLDFALSCAPNHIDLFPLSVLPGTRLCDEAESLNLPFRKGPPYTVTGSASFPAQDLKKAASLSETADRLYNKCRAVPWFLEICEAFGLAPTELIDSIDAADIPAEEKERPAYLAGLVRRLAVSQKQEHLGDILADMVVLLTLESAGRENLALPSELRFTYNPIELARHLEMGISDPEELQAFVPRQTGTHRLLAEGGELIFNGFRKSGEKTV